MDRRELLGVLGATAAGLATVAGMTMGGNAAHPMNAAPVPATPAVVAPSMAPAAGAAAVGATYYCPMHPNVMSTFPATCPYCRMALKRR